MRQDVIRVALDESLRFYSEDGHLHVRTSHISKANVCGYYGKEIPDADRLGLDPKKMYQMLRDPSELEKAVSTFNNLPILSKHIPVTSADHPADKVIGSTGTDAVWSAPFIDNSLVFWTDEAVAMIESKTMRELSSAYHYDPDMTPGTYNGEPYDGVMRNIRGNHVALVEDGRAGSDVVVMDSALADSDKESNMPKTVRRVSLSPRAAVVRGALGEYLRPKLAQDQALPDLSAMLLGVTAKNYDQKKATIGAALQRWSKDKLAQDAGLGDVHDFLDKFGGKGEPEMADAKDDEPRALEGDLDPEDTNPMARDDDLVNKLREMLSSKLDPADLEMVLKMVAPSDAVDPAKDEDPDDKDDKDKKDVGVDTAKDDAPPDKSAGNKYPVMKPAMDKAIKLASDAAVRRAVDETKEQMRATAEAERFVRPWVGEIQVAMDSAADVYKFALEKVGVATDDVHPSAYRALLALVQKPGDAPVRARVAMDAKSVGGFYERFPDAKRMRVVG